MWIRGRSNRSFLLCRDLDRWPPACWQLDVGQAKGSHAILSLSLMHIHSLSASLCRVARQAAASPPLGINNSAGDWLLPPGAGTFCSFAACWRRRRRRGGSTEEGMLRLLISSQQAGTTHRSGIIMGMHYKAEHVKTKVFFLGVFGGIGDVCASLCFLLSFTWQLACAVQACVANLAFVLSHTFYNMFVRLSQCFLQLIVHLCEVYFYSKRVVIFYKYVGKVIIQDL